VSRKSRSFDSQNARQGLPETLKLIGTEKRVKTIAAKVEPSLALYLKQHGGSAFVHTLILHALCAIAEPE